MTYREKLLDPRWQKKRLFVLERDNWTCQACQSTTKTLNVHHKFYEGYKDPWDYDDNVLVTLCQECHASEEGTKAIFKAFTNKLLLAGFNYENLSMYLLGLMVVPTFEVSRFDRVRLAGFATSSRSTLDFAAQELEANKVAFMEAINKLVEE